MVLLIHWSGAAWFAWLGYQIEPREGADPAAGILFVGILLLAWAAVVWQLRVTWRIWKNPNSNNPNPVERKTLLRNPSANLLPTATPLPMPSPII